MIILKFKHIQGPLKLNSKTFKYQICFQGLKNGQKSFKTFKTEWPPRLMQPIKLQTHTPWSRSYIYRKIKKIWAHYQLHCQGMLWTWFTWSAPPISGLCMLCTHQR